MKSNLLENKKIVKLIKKFNLLLEDTNEVK